MNEIIIFNFSEPQFVLGRTFSVFFCLLAYSEIGLKSPTEEKGKNSTGSYEMYLKKRKQSFYHAVTTKKLISLSHYTSTQDGENP